MRYIAVGLLIVTALPVMWLLAAACFIGMGADWLSQKICRFVATALRWASTG